MIIFLFVFVAVIGVAFIYFLLKGRNEASANSDKALPEDKTEFKKSVTPIETTEAEIMDENWINEILPDLPEEPKPAAGKHLKEKSATEQPEEDLRIEQLLEDSMPKVQKNTVQDNDMCMATKINEPAPWKNPGQPAGQAQKCEQPEENVGRKQPGIITVMEILCAIAWLLATISTSIAWYVYTIRNG